MRQCCAAVWASRVCGASARRRSVRFRCFGSETAFRHGTQAVHTTWEEAMARTGLSHPFGAGGCVSLERRETRSLPVPRSAHDVTQARTAGFTCNMAQADEAAV